MDLEIIQNIGLCMLHKNELDENLTSHNQVNIMLSVTSENTKPVYYCSFFKQ